MAKDVRHIADRAFSAAEAAWRRTPDGSDRETQLVLAMAIAALAAAIAERTERR